MTTKGKKSTATKMSREVRLTQLDELELTGSSSRNILISNVKQMFQKGVIRTITVAENLIKLIQENKLDEFDEKFSKIEKAENTRAAKQRSEEIARESNYTIQQKELSKHVLRVKNQTSEAPTFELEFKKSHKYFDSAWKDGVNKLIKLAAEKIREKQNLKIVVGCDFTIVKGIEAEEVSRKVYARTAPEGVYSEDAVDKFIRSKKGELSKSMQNVIDRQVGSGWAVSSIDGLFITTYTQKASRGSSYIPTPSTLNNSKYGLVNIKNEDQQCFKYCMLYHQSDKMKHSDRLTALKKVEDRYNWEGVNFPTTLENIQQFEDNNKVCVNVFQHLGEKKIDRLRLGTIQYVKYDNINLLLIKDENDNGHYIYIKKLESLMHTVKTAFYSDRQFCPHCNKTIGKDEIYEEHLMRVHYDCHNNCNLVLPKEGATMKFSNFKNMLERPFFVSCDFECSLIKTEMSDKIARHEPNSAGAYFVCTFDSTRNKYYKFAGTNCVLNLIEQLRLIATRCIEEQKQNERMIMTKEDEKNFKKATVCSICSKPFDDIKYKVRDHCHRTGKYRGAAHNCCNINYYSNRFLPVVFHNLRGYDSHLIIKKAFEVMEGKEKIDAIPNSGEKFMTFSIGNLKFIDSYQFMKEKLENLTKSLKNKNGDPYEKFEFMKQHFSKEELKLVGQKGFYPYEFIDSPEKLTYPGLPPKEAFYSHVYLEEISDEDYQHAQTVYKTFNCKDFGDYHWLYLKTDVLLLADIFENFRKLSLEHYRLDPANYLTAASLAWDAMLLKTGVDLELITDAEILTMIEQSKRGGLTFVGSKRYAKANNKHMGDNYDKTKESTYISYVDANNLYGFSMVQPLPYKDLKFETIESCPPTSGTTCPETFRTSSAERRSGTFRTVSLETILNTADDAETGYFCEVDLEFPPELHEKLKQFPPCPESIIPQIEWFSDYQKEVMEITNSKPTSQKLIPHLMKHENYVLHYRNLKFINSLGVIIKLKRVISFKQSSWMAPYINDNNKLRAKAKSEGNKFLDELFKLMNNSVFGKTMEDVRNRMDMRLTTDPDYAIKYFSKPQFKSANFIDGLYLIQSHKTQMLYDKPVYVGCTVLDISKVRMMQFHYNTIEKNFKGAYDLLYSDTDSLVYQIKHPNLLKWMKDNEDEYDLSNLTGKLKSCKNESVLGKMKNEVGDKIITEFCALSAKSYAYKYCEKEVKKAKGVSLSVSDKTMDFNDYKRVLDFNKSQERKIYGIRSFNQQLFTYVEDKVVLNSMYDKLKLLDSINCEPFGFVSN